MKRYKSYDEIRSDLRKGIEVFWSNKSYIVIEEPIYPADTSMGQRQRQMSAVKDDKMVVARCKSNWFGGCLAESEIGACFSES